MPVCVNETAIDEMVIAREVQNHPADSLETARRRAVRALVIRELLLQEAKRRGIKAADLPTENTSGDAPGNVLGVGPEEPEESVIARLLEEAVNVPAPDRETCRRYYLQNAARFRSPDLFEAAHILFAADPEDDKAREAAEVAARATLEDLQAAPERFATLAEERSACSSARDGGSLGQVARGDTVPEFETFLYSLEEGQLCPVPIPTRYGFHVLRLDRRIEGRQLPFEMVAETIADYLQEQSWRRGVRQFIQILAGGARIEGAEIDFAATPLVQ